jgi:outer membrane protein OmpA-like peptidoglycan-associated protein
MSYTAITNSIYAKLQTVTRLNAVFNYEVKSSDAYPYACVAPLSNSDEVFDTAENRLSYQIMIRIIDFNKESATMEAEMRNVVDDVLDELREDPTL